MRRLILLLLSISACAPEPGPEQLAARRAEGLLHAAGHDNATLLAPLAGLDGDGQPGVCGLIETRAGPVRVVVALASGQVRAGVPATQGGSRVDLGESRFCSETALNRWDQVKKGDPIGLIARIGA
ncbi:hypothetical protein [Sandarakinorhabdus sp. AAP62]|uniref:hypothetical protein n=1 Tax=Sandarakinorhabdus sp. AAP62 TaxID=1248916 RepID=UPI00036C484B|nr:hypothetical protein [Sandarakinorhabdus sp. AAP62]